MADFDERATLKEQTLPSGETLTITFDGRHYLVDCWAADGEGRWNKSFDTQDAATAEFNRFAS